MALVACRECGKEVSDQAEQCPNCGIRGPQPGMEPAVAAERGLNMVSGVLQLMLGLAFLAGLIWIVWSVFTMHPHTR